MICVWPCWGGGGGGSAVFPLWLVLVMIWWRFCCRCIILRRFWSEMSWNYSTVETFCCHGITAAGVARTFGCFAMTSTVARVILICIQDKFLWNALICIHLYCVARNLMNRRILCQCQAVLDWIEGLWIPCCNMDRLSPGANKDLSDQTHTKNSIRNEHKERHLSNIHWKETSTTWPCLQNERQRADKMDRAWSNGRRKHRRKSR